MTWKIIVAPTAAKMLEAIRDRRVRKLIVSKISRLETEPDKKGKPLQQELAGFWSARAVGQRYRIIYELNRVTFEVNVVAIGIRRAGSKQDVYEMAKRLLGQRGG